MVACSDYGKPKNNIIESTTNKDLKLEKKSNGYNFQEPFDIQHIKTRANKSSTSGVVPHSQSKSFCKQLGTGFYGFYYLLMNDSHNGPVGLMTVYTNDHPNRWRYDTVNELLYSLELETKDITLWDSISIGMNKNDLLEFINGNTIDYNKNQIVTTLGDFNSTFQISNDTVYHIKIERNCSKEILHSQ